NNNYNEVIEIHDDDDQALVQTAGINKKQKTLVQTAKNNKEQKALEEVTNNIIIQIPATKKPLDINLNISFNN
ncbi:9841_t:CDS:1, partial [Scutellospora calospora]